MSRLAAHIAACAVIATAAAASVSPIDAADTYRADPALVAAAKQEGEVVLYTTLIVDQIVRPLIAAFRAQVADIDIKYVRADSTPLVVRLTTEARSGHAQSDIWHLIDGVGALVHAGIAAPLDLPSAAGLPPTLFDPNRHWVATNLSMRSLAYNTGLVQKAAAPRNYADLLDPRWKGKMAWSPNSTSGAWGFIGTVLEAMGEDKGLAYLHALARQDIIPVPMSIRALLDRVIAGEYPIGLEMNPIHAAISAARGAPVQWVPLEPVTAALQVVGITAGAAHPNAAQLFIDFMVSQAGQQVFRNAGYLPMRPDVPAKDTALQIPQGSFKKMVHNPEDVDANSRRWATIYADVFR